MKNILLIIVSFFAISSAFAQSSLSLAQAIEMGLENSFQIKIAEQNLSAAQNNNNWGTAGRYPTVALQLTNGNTYTNQNNPASFLRELSSVSTGITPAANAQVTLYNGNRVKLSKQNLDIIEAQSVKDIRIAVEDVAKNIMLAYNNVLIIQQQLDVLDEVLTLSRDRIDYQRVRQEYGQASQFNILQAQDAYLADSTNFVNLTNSYQLAMQALNFAMQAEDLSYEYTLTDKLIDATGIISLENIKASVKNNNSDLQKAYFNQQLAQVNSNIQNASKLPTVSLQGGLQYNANLASGSGTQGNGMTLELDAVTSNSFNGFVNVVASYNLIDPTRKTRIQNAKIQQGITDLNIQNLEAVFNNQAELLFKNYQNQKALLDLSKQRVATAKRNLEISLERFKGGQISSFDYRALQVAYTNAAQAETNALFQLKNTEIEILRLTGEIVQ